MYVHGVSSWENVRVRRGERHGTIAVDHCWNLRTLTVKMDDGAEEKIVLNNKGDDPEETHEWEYFWNKSEPNKWYRF